FGSLNLRIKNVKEFSIHVFYCSVIKVPVVLTALIFYHIIFSLSRTFLKVFDSRSAVLFFFSTAILDYHICIALSRTF
ncbi:hypothetical protein, partial [Blautia sp.]|uniref:hypothetical protein n=1 Tax=Blautia sp. TaxID=1955243 RepID=UPI00258D53B3